MCEMPRGDENNQVEVESETTNFVEESTIPTEIETKKENKIKWLKKTYPYLFLTIIGVIILIFCIAFDQISKYVALGTLETVGTSVTFIPGFINFTLTLNKGAAWGVGSGSDFSRIILILISRAVAIGFIGYFIYAVVKKKEIKLGAFIICAFIVGGDIGNLIDRTFFYDRGVIDFLDITSWWPGFGIFNVADSILVCSIIALIIYIIVEVIKDSRWYRTRKAQKEENDD